MRRTTIIGCFIGLLSLTLSAQSTQPSSSKSDSGTTNVEVQKKHTASIQELLVRHQNLGSKSGSLSEYFSKEEQQMLHSYYNNQAPAKSNKVIKGVRTDNSAKPKQDFVPDGLQAVSKSLYTPLFVAPVLKDNSEEARGIIVTAENRAALKQKAPLFMAPSVLTTEEEAEVLAAAQQGVNANVGYSSVLDYGKILAAIVPAAGATESFPVVTGDFFYDPTDGVNGGPGGDCSTTSSGNLGDYPNCGCVTTTTLTGSGLSVEFLSFNIFGNFDFLNIYDGPDTSSPQIYDSNLNASTDTLAGMIAANGSGVFTSTSGALTFEFNATAVVNTCGWEVEVLSAGGGGGGGTTCSQDHPFGAAAAGGTGSSVDSDFKGAADIVVTAGEDFILDTIEVPFLTFAPNDPPITANVVYYEDAGGLPGAMIGSETVVPTILSSSPWANPIADQYLTSLAVTPFTFAGDAGSDTTYWIEVSMGTATNQGTVFWEYTDDIPVEGEPFAIFDATLGFWASTTIPAQELVYDFIGNCEPIGGGGGCTPNSLDTLYAGGNFGSVGGAVYFDITVGAEDIEISSFDMNTAEAGNFTMDVYVFEGTYVGNQGTPATWGASVATGSGTSAGAGLPSAATLDNVIVMSANTTYAVALVFDATHAHQYTNGDGTNQNYSNGDITLDLGSASNVPFTAPIFDPRIWNGTVGYCVGGGGGGGGALATAYGINNGNFELIGFPVSDPSTVEVFGDSPITVNFENAGAIDPANPTTGYALDNGGQFYSFDVASGFYTLLGNIPGDWVGMEFDRSSGILYAIAGADLYTIDPVGVSATLVGATGINPADLPIALAIDGAGVGYTYEIVSDNLYSIDLATATATLIGNIGFDANFGQGMCYDPTTDMVYMSAFNSTTFTGEWRSVNTATGTSTLIGPIVTTAATTQVAWVSIGETLPPPACPEPTNLMVSNITSTTADLSWDAEPNASSGYIWYVFDQGANPVSDPPVATGTVPAGTTTATATGLAGGFNYDFYVVADCDTDGLSQLAGPANFATPPACGGKFYDTGGAGGDYQNSENVTTTISPENAGELVTVTFTAFEVEATWDALYVYDGPDASSPLISSGNPATNSGFPAGGYYGTTIPGPFVSSDPSGALTFVFMSDASVPQSGWEADVTCALSPPPNDMIVNSIDVDEIGFPYTDPAVHMPAATTEDGSPVNCDLTGANGVWYNFVPTGDGTANATIVTPGGASSVTFYTAPNENAVETDLTLVPQQTNQCAPGTSASIFTLAGQAYYVFVMNTGAVTDIVIDGTNLGVSDNTIAGFSYYPNPTNGILNLKSVDNIENVSIYNLLGQLVINNRVNATTSQVDISGLSTGTYVMRVSVNGQIGTYRVLKQ